MDSYGDLQFQNDVDCLPLDLHFGGKPDEVDNDCQELINNDGNDSTFKITLTDLNVEHGNPLESCEVTLGNVIVQQEVHDLEHDIFLYEQGNENVIQIPPQTIPLLVPVSTQKVIANDIITDVYIGADIVKVEPTPEFSLDNKGVKSELDINCEVDNAVATLLKHVSSSITGVNEHKDFPKLSNDSHSITPKKVCDSKIKTENTKIKKQHECKECGKTFREKSHLATHSRAHVNIRNFSCDVCGLRFKTKSNLYFHSQTHSEAPFNCSECNKTFSERKILNRHIRVVHSYKELHKCDQCDKTFKSATILSLHYTLHTGAKPFQCSMCPKSFVYKSTLSMHINQHHMCTICLTPSCRHRSRSWLCTFCGKGYSSKARLNAHMKSHDPEKAFKCNECPKSFVKKQSYEAHKKWHAGEEPQFMCDQCSQSYFNAFALRRHYLKHTTKRSFICDVCAKAFWMKDALKVHMRSHTNEKPFQCPKCPKAFGHKHSLEGHLKTHKSSQEHTIGSKKSSRNGLVQSPTPLVSDQQFIYYQFPPPLEPSSHYVITHADQNTQQSLHVQ